jgi:hypothetical protein
MNIFVGKLGKSILFNRKSWGSIGGDNEAPTYYENLFYHNPEVNFYLIGSNDYSRLDERERNRINRHGNVHDIWGEGWKNFKKNHTVTKLGGRVAYVDHWAAESKRAGLEMDGGIIIAGPNATTNIPYRCTQMKNPTQESTPIEMIGCYTGPLASYLNEYRVPYILIVNDPRYFPFMAKDIMHAPGAVLSQYNETIQYKHRIAYKDNTVNSFPLECLYASMETIYLIDPPPAAPDECTLDSFFNDEPTVESPPVEKDVSFLVVLNEGRPSRYDMLKNSILDGVQDVEIYGKWDPETIGDDSRFKGSLPYEELQRLLPRVKYSYCIPIKKGWCTMKFWELINHGVIPFLHPTYDEQNNLKAPEFLRVPDSKELFKRIRFLEENPDAYNTLLTNLKNMITSEHRDGTLLNRTTMNSLKAIIN